MFESCYNAYDTECIYDVLLLSLSFTLGSYGEFKQIVLDYATEFAKMKSMRSTHHTILCPSWSREARRTLPAAQTSCILTCLWTRDATCAAIRFEYFNNHFLDWL